MLFDAQLTAVCKVALFTFLALDSRKKGRLNICCSAERIDAYNGIVAVYTIKNSKYLWSTLA